MGRGVFGSPGVSPGADFPTHLSPSVNLCKSGARFSWLWPEGCVVVFLVVSNEAAEVCDWDVRCNSIAKMRLQHPIPPTRSGLACDTQGCTGQRREASRQ